MGVKAVVAFAQFLSHVYVEFPEPRKSLLTAFYLAISAAHTPHHLALALISHYTMMNYPDTTPADLPAFSLWQDALVPGEDMAAWAQPQPAGYTQPGVDSEGIPLDILDSALAWGQSGTSRIEEPMPQTDFVSIFAFGMGEGLHSF